MENRGYTVTKVCIGPILLCAFGLIGGFTFLRAMPTLSAAMQTPGPNPILRATLSNNCRLRGEFLVDNALFSLRCNDRVCSCTAVSGNRLPINYHDELAINVECSQCEIESLTTARDCYLLADDILAVYPLMGTYNIRLYAYLSAARDIKG